MVVFSKPIVRKRKDQFDSKKKNHFKYELKKKIIWIELKLHCCYTVVMRFTIKIQLELSKLIFICKKKTYLLSGKSIVGS